MRHIRKNFGLSTLEAVVCVFLFGVLVLVIASQLNTYIKGVELARSLGIKEDLRNYVRERIDCVQTARMEHTKCNSGASINAYDSELNPIVNDLINGKTFGKSKLKLTCTKRGTSLLININAQVRNESGFSSISDVPIICHGRCGIPVWGSMDPVSFPLPPMVQNSGWLRSVVKNRADECGVSFPNSFIPIRRSTNGPGASKKGKEKPFITGTLDPTSLTETCKMLGYETYISSTCVDQDDSDLRCNFTSPGGDKMIYFDGTNWLETPLNVEYHSWVATIQCSGYKYK